MHNQLKYNKMGLSVLMVNGEPPCIRAHYNVYVSAAAAADNMHMIYFMVSAHNIIGYTVVVGIRRPLLIMI